MLKYTIESITLFPSSNKIALIDEIQQRDYEQINRSKTNKRKERIVRSLEMWGGQGGFWTVWVCGPSAHAWSPFPVSTNRVFVIYIIYIYIHLSYILLQIWNWCLECQKRINSCRWEKQTTLLYNLKISEAVFNGEKDKYISHPMANTIDKMHLMCLLSLRLDAYHMD